jgi:hypothetical protein
MGQMKSNPNFWTDYLLPNKNLIGFQNDNASSIISW